MDASQGLVQICGLPIEVWDHVARYLDVRSLIRLINCSKQVSRALGQRRSVWSNAAQKALIQDSIPLEWVGSMAVSPVELRKLATRSERIVDTLTTQPPKPLHCRHVTLVYDSRFPGSWSHQCDVQILPGGVFAIGTAFNDNLKQQYAFCWRLPTSEEAPAVVPVAKCGLRCKNSAASAIDYQMNETGDGVNILIETPASTQDEMGWAEVVVLTWPQVDAPILTRAASSFTHCPPPEHDFAVAWNPPMNFWEGSIITFESFPFLNIWNWVEDTSAVVMLTDFERADAPLDLSGLWHNSRVIYVLTSHGRRLQAYAMPELTKPRARAIYPIRLASFLTTHSEYKQDVEITKHTTASGWRFPKPGSLQYAGQIVWQGPESEPKIVYFETRIPEGPNASDPPLPLPTLVHEDSIPPAFNLEWVDHFTTSDVAPRAFVMLDTHLAPVENSAALAIQGHLSIEAGERGQRVQRGHAFSLLTDLTSAEWGGAYVPSRTVCFRSGKLLVSQWRDETRRQADGSEQVVEKYYHALIELDQD